jgi:hypothetical protein
MKTLTVLIACLLLSVNAFCGPHLKKGCAVQYRDYNAIGVVWKPGIYKSKDSHGLYRIKTPDGWVMHLDRSQILKTGK